MAEQKENKEKFKKPTIAEITRQGIRDGLTDQEIAAKLDEVFGEGAGKINCIRWYRYQDPQLTGRPRTTSVKKAEIHSAFREALNGMTDEKRVEVVLELVQKYFDSFIQKIPVEDLKVYIPEDLLPKAPEKAPKEPKEPKAKKGKGKKAEAETAPEAPVAEGQQPEVAPFGE